MPPALNSSNNQGNNHKVIIHLSDVNAEETYPERIITLQHPNWSVELGRGSLSDELIVPDPTNGWFTSKVMSRLHALIKADPEAMMVTIRDTGSMHGTYLNGEKLHNEDVELMEDDTITFGTDVVRQAETFAPLTTNITFEWSNEKSQATSTAEKDKSTDQQTKNSFTADFGEDDVYSDLDDDLEIVHESVVRQPSVEILERTPAKITTPSVSTSPSARSNERRDSNSSAPTSSPSVQNETKTTTLPSIGAIITSGPSQLVHAADSEYSDDQSEHDHDSDSGQSVELTNPFYVIEEDEEEESDQENLITDEDVYYYKKPAPRALVPKEIPARQPSPSDAAMAKPRPKTPPRASTTTAPLSTCPPANQPSSTFEPLYDPQRYNGAYFAEDYAGMYDYHAGSFHSPFSTLNYCDDPLQRAPTSPSSSSGFRSGVQHCSYPANPFGSFGAYRSHPGSRTAPLHPYSLPNPNSIGTSSSVDVPPSARAENSNNKPYYNTAKGTKRTATEMTDDTSDLIASPSIRIPTVPQDQSAEQHEKEPSQAESDPKCNVQAQKLISESPSKEDTDRVELPIGPVESEFTSMAIHEEIKEASKPIATDIEKHAQEENEEPKEPPRKKAKGIMGTAVKYTATALAGATVGAFGVVLGLASLPPDYFV